MQLCCISQFGPKPSEIDGLAVEGLFPCLVHLRGPDDPAFTVFFTHCFRHSSHIFFAVQVAEFVEELAITFV